MAGRLIQPRFLEKHINVIEKRARELGFITPRGKTNLGGYARYCVFKELQEAGYKLDIKDEDEYIWEK
jgi:hypothetical protein